MTTQVMAAPPVRTVRAALLAGLAGVVAPHLATLAWALLSSAVWGAGWRVAAFLARGPIAWWALWAAFGAGVVLSAAALGPLSLLPPVLPLFIISSALGFRLGSRR